MIHWYSLNNNNNKNVWHYEIEKLEKLNKSKNAFQSKAYHRCKTQITNTFVSDRKLIPNLI